MDQVDAAISHYLRIKPTTRGGKGCAPGLTVADEVRKALNDFPKLKAALDRSDSKDLRRLQRAQESLREVRETVDEGLLTLYPEHAVLAQLPALDAALTAMIADRQWTEYRGEPKNARRTESGRNATVLELARIFRAYETPDSHAYLPDFIEELLDAHGIPHPQDLPRFLGDLER